MEEAQYSYTIRPATEADLPYLPDIEKSAGSLFRTMPELAYLADDEPTSVEQHRWYINDAKNLGPDGGGVIVAVASSITSTTFSSSTEEDQPQARDHSKPVAFIASTLHRCDGGNISRQATDAHTVECYFLHIHEISVHTDHQRRGLAKRLFEAVGDSIYRTNNASGGDCVEVCKFVVATTLTTFRDVGFNAPFYRKLGFYEITSLQIKEMLGLEALNIWNEEQERFKAHGIEKRRCWMLRKIDKVNVY